MKSNDIILGLIWGTQFFLFIFPLTISPVQAQTNSHLEIRGESELKAIPDEVTCQLRNQLVRNDYDDALKALDRQLKEVKKVLVKLSFPEDQIKTRSFSIGPNRFYQRGVSRDSGFVARQDLEVTFTFDRETVVQLINEISDSKANPSLSFAFGFTRAREQELEEQLIVDAVADASEKAKLIAASAGVELGNVRRIQYDPTPSRQPYQGIMAQRVAESDEMDFGGFQIPEMELSRNILIEWSID